MTLEPRPAPSSLGWRCIGPSRGGRVPAVAGDPHDRLRFYFGSSGGGVWATGDGGRAWTNITDGQLRTASVGALGVAASDPNVIYAGMGECNIRQNVSIGDGVYRSTDRGATWRHLGLTETRQISRVRIHPNDPDVVYIAALGHAFGANPQRGVFRSYDGGFRWDHLLTRGDRAGAIDLSMDLTNPRILFAAFWEARRTFWDLTSGGPGSGIWRSVDGGDSWTDLSRAPGLPHGLLGRIGVAASGPKSGRVWAVIEAERGAGGVFRSEDRGDTWQRVSDGKGILHRPWYYSHIFAHPTQADVIYLADELLWRSSDGGVTYRQIPTPHGDNHDLWIDPSDPLRMIEGNDGGACVTLNGGRSWSSLYNQPTAEIYHIVADSRFPYRVYGAQQDSSTISVPSRSEQAVITQRDYYDVGGRECGSIAVRPDDPDIVYAGGQRGIITRFDRRTGQRRNIMVWPEDFDGWGSKDCRYRFSWTFPIALSPHDPNVLYATAQYVFRTKDEGETWTAISPDLTRCDLTKMERSGGPITKDNTCAETYAVVFAFAESPRRPGLLWAGTDDGLIHVSTDGGGSWRDVTPRDLYPEFSLVSTIEPSSHDDGTAYVAITAHKLDDYRPYVLKTTDLGRTWTCSADGLPIDSFARVVREDPVRRGLLYLGTETGVHWSVDAGVTWRPLQLNLPAVPVHDLVVKDSDLAIATHGRSFWILDDCTPLRTPMGTGEPLPLLYPPRDTFRVVKPNLAGIQGLGSITDFVETETPTQFQGTPGYIEFTSYQRRDDQGRIVTHVLDAGENPPEGVIITYELASAEHKVQLSIDGPRGCMRAFTDRAPGPHEERGLPCRAGANRFVWDMRHRGTASAGGPVYAHSSLAGPLAAPGRYTVSLMVTGETRTASFTLLIDPRATATQRDLEQQEDLALRIRDLASQLIEIVNSARRLRRELAALADRSDTAGVATDVSRCIARLDEIEEGLIESRASHWKEVRHWTAKPINKLAYLLNVVGSADARPTPQSYQVFDAIASTIDVHRQRLTQLTRGPVAELEGRLAESSIPRFPKE